MDDVISERTLRSMAMKAALRGPRSIPFDLRVKMETAKLRNLINRSALAAKGWEQLPNGDLKVKGWRRPATGWVRPGSDAPAVRDLPAISHQVSGQSSRVRVH